MNLVFLGLSVVYWIIIIIFILIFLFIIFIIYLIISKITRKIYFSDKDKKNIKNYKLKPSTAYSLYQSNDKFKFLDNSFNFSYFKKKNICREIDKNCIGGYGEKKFLNENPQVKKQVRFETINWKGYKDFEDKYYIYEIKTTECRGYIKDYYTNKWIFQLACYIYFSIKTKGILIVYQVNFKEEIIRPKFIKKVYKNSKIVWNIGKLDEEISAWKDLKIKKGFICYKPSGFWDGIKAIRISRNTKKEWNKLNK